MTTVAFETYVSGLGVATNPTGPELVPIVQGGAPKQVTVASLIGNEQTAAEIAAGVTPVNYAYAQGVVQRYGLLDDNATDNGSKITTLVTLAQAGIALYWPKLTTGIYLTSTPLLFAGNITMTGDAGVRIKLTAAASYVVKVDSSAVGPGYSHGGMMADLILDGNGFATDGLYLRNVVSANYYRIRATNVTQAGLHLAWGQLCVFDTFICSNNVETFTTTPQYGILIDNANSGGSSSANTFINPTAEGITSGSGIGIFAQWAIDSVFINGTSEGNKIGMVIGAIGTSDGSHNTVIGMDMESNTVQDMQIYGPSNTVLAPSFYSAFPLLISGTGAAENRVIGGTVSSVSFGAGSGANSVTDTSLSGVGASITDAGTYNAWRGIYAGVAGAFIPDQTVRRRQNYVLSATGSVSIDLSVCSYASVTFTGSATSTITFNAPTNATDGVSIDINVQNSGTGALTLAWVSGAGGWSVAGIVVPATGHNRNYRFLYNPYIGSFELASMSPADIPG